ncbi:S-layer homology domain-containing protein [Patescibacteria group bacterium]|nr:S-layer homology domain-containing protein [Patescibacteria group bacterium]MBU1758468.1 S-layer homology domain-containing protein [Patescibacteria group bacterium]
MFNGYPDGTFKPFNSLTQGEAIAVLMRIYLGKKLNEQDIFPRYKNYFNEAKRL